MSNFSRDWFRSPFSWPCRRPDMDECENRNHERRCCDSDEGIRDDGRRDHMERDNMRCGGRRNWN